MWWLVSIHICICSKVYVNGHGWNCRERKMYVKKKTKTLATQREKEREKCARARHQDVNALKVCGLNQGHFMNASDYMSVCQSTRKVNNPFVVGWQRAALAGARLDLGCRCVAVAVAVAAVLIPLYCCCSRFASLIYVFYMRCTMCMSVRCLRYRIFFFCFTHMCVTCIFCFLFFVFLVSYGLSFLVGYLAMFSMGSLNTYHMFWFDLKFRTHEMNGQFFQFLKQIRFSIFFLQISC